jgi:hypothetical protein
MLFGWRNPAFAALLFSQEKGAAMAKITAQPPAFDKNDLAGTLKKMCDYCAKLNEELQFALSQIEKKEGGKN